MVGEYRGLSAPEDAAIPTARTKTTAIKIRTCAKPRSCELRACELLRSELNAAKPFSFLSTKFILKFQSFGCTVNPTFSNPLSRVRISLIFKSFANV